MPRVWCTGSCCCPGQPPMQPCRHVASCSIVSPVFCGLCNLKLWKNSGRGRRSLAERGCACLYSVCQFTMVGAPMAQVELSLIFQELRTQDSLPANRTLQLWQAIFCLDHPTFCHLTLVSFWSQPSTFWHSAVFFIAYIFVHFYNFKCTQRITLSPNNLSRSLAQNVNMSCLA